jgi:putative membrane protein
MKFGLLAVALGGACVTGLVGWFGAKTIGHEVLAADWAIPVAVLIHLVQLFLSAVAWRIAIGADQPRTGRFFRIRWIREAINSMLPVAQLGGNIVGIRLLVLRGVTAALAGAGTTLDITIEALTQFLFTLAGICTLATVDADRSWAPWLDGSLALMALGVGGFIVAQRLGAMRIIELLAVRLHRMFPSLSVESLLGLNAELMRLERDGGALLRASVLHLSAWFLGVAETWLILRALNLPLGLAAAMVIESLGMAARSAGFVVPGALGVQETGFILVCGLFGVPADTAIALSMVKRARELLVGVPGLIAWQWTEGKRLLRRPPAV